MRRKHVHWGHLCSQEIQGKLLDSRCLGPFNNEPHNKGTINGGKWSNEPMHSKEHSCLSGPLARLCTVPVVDVGDDELHELARDGSGGLALPTLSSEYEHFFEKIQ